MMIGELLVNARDRFEARFLDPALENVIHHMFDEEPAPVIGTRQFLRESVSASDELAPQEFEQGSEVVPAGRIRHTANAIGNSVLLQLRRVDEALVSLEK